MEKAIRIVQAGDHDPLKAHDRIRGFYDWGIVAERAERVYERVLETPPYEFWTRMRR